MEVNVLFIRNRKVARSLGERAILSEHGPAGRVSTTISSSPNFHECLYNLIETKRTCFLFLLENVLSNIRETTCLL